MYHCHKNLAGESKNERILPLHFFMQYKGREKKKKDPTKLTIKPQPALSLWERYCQVTIIIADGIYASSWPC